MSNCFSPRFISRLTAHIHILNGTAKQGRGLLLLAALCISASAFGQARTTIADRDWNLFGGMSYQHPLSDSGIPDNLYGWDVAVSQSPYPTLPWFGGVIEASGAYASSTQRAGGISLGVNEAASARDVAHASFAVMDTNDALYSVMGGPLFSVRTGGFRPFAQVLVGVNIARATETVAGLSSTQSSTEAAFALGGGADVSLSPLVAIRTQVEWGRNFRNSSSLNGGSLRAATGLVFRF